MIYKRISQYSSSWGRSLRLLLVVALMLPLVAITPGPTPLQAGNGKGDPKAHPGLLKQAKDHPNDTVRVIVQKDMMAKDLPDEEPEQTLGKAGGKVNKITGYRSSPMGLTPDAVKETPEWKAAKSKADAAFRALRDYNVWYLKAFKADISADRSNRHHKAS